MQTDMQIFHRQARIFKTPKYLLITGSFPHSPQVFPQEFSTAVPGCGYSFLVHIKRTGSFTEFPHFFEGGGFYYGGFFVQKFGLDTGVNRWAMVSLAAGLLTVPAGWAARFDGLAEASGFFGKGYCNSSGIGEGIFYGDSWISDCKKTEEFFKIGG